MGQMNLDILGGGRVRVFIGQVITVVHFDLPDILADHDRLAVIERCGRDLAGYRPTVRNTNRLIYQHGRDELGELGSWLTLNPDFEVEVTHWRGHRVNMPMRYQVLALTESLQQPMQLADAVNHHSVCGHSRCSRWHCTHNPEQS